LNHVRGVKRLVVPSVLALVAAGVWSDISIQWKGQPPSGQDVAFCSLYNIHTVVTVQGTVQRAEKRIAKEGLGSGIYLILKTDTETLPVHLGPVSYVEKQLVQIHAQDAVAVTGSRVICNGKPVILAASVKKGDQIVKYREKTGVPSWINPPH